MTPPTEVDEAQTREQIDCQLALAGWAIQDKKRLDKFAGQQIWTAEGSPKGQVAGTQPDQLLDQQEDWLAQQLERDQNLRSRFRKYLMNRAAVLKCSVNSKFAKDDVHGRTSVASAGCAGATDDHCDRMNKLARDKFAGQQICDAESYPKGQAAGMQPDQLFDESNQFSKKITYKVGKREAEESIKAFRTDPQFRIAVTVDMIATGTDIRPLECVMFMRDVKSQAYYEQMKGRGTRVISRDELPKVTPDAPGKSRYVLVDCVGVTETDKTETKSLETKPSVSTAKLMEQVARGDRHSDTLRALGNRMIRNIARKAA